MDQLRSLPEPMYAIADPHIVMLMLNRYLLCSPSLKLAKLMLSYLNGYFSKSEQQFVWCLAILCILLSKGTNIHVSLWLIFLARYFKI